MKRIYLDNNATTPVDPRLLELFVSAAFTTFGNPSSVHGYGQAAKALLVKARDDIAKIFGVRSQEIVFTASATEALNMIIRGFFGSKPTGHLITSDVEHLAVYATVEHLKSQGLDVTYLKAGEYGAPHPEALEQAIRPDTRLIVLMGANNETGVLTDYSAMGEIAQKRGIPLVVDGVQLFGKEKIALTPGISAMCFSGHKCYAPKGGAFAIVKKGFSLEPHLRGGHQEHGLRAGTENLASIVSLAQGVAFVARELCSFLEPIRTLRDYFEQRVLALKPDATINGKGPRIANTSNICFTNIDGEALLMYLDLHGVAASLGSACSSGALEPSRVLLNMGLSRKQALSSVRFSLGRYTTKEEIDETLKILSKFFDKEVISGR